MSYQLPYAVQPGWYPDPVVPHQQRYWNGSAWTDQIAPGVMQSQTSTYAILAIILAFVFFPLGIVFGVMGRREIDASGGAKTGRTLATAGMWVGIAHGILIGLILVLYFVFIIVVIIGAAVTGSQ
jgi:hypothetical protein